MSKKNRDNFTNYLLTLKLQFMEEKKFNCKMEDVPVVTGFALSSMENDKADFLAYSPIFADPFADNVRAKQTVCMELVKSRDIVTQQKAVTKLIGTKLNKLRVSLNPIEGYLKLAGSDLDIQVSDFGLTAIRKDLSNENVEGVIAKTQSFIANLTRNQAALQAKGMKPEAIADLAALMGEISQLNQQQNELKNKRSRVASDNIKDFNELWDMLSTILDAGRALYRGVDAVKLKEYTLSSLLKRVHNVNPEPVTPAEIQA